MTAPLRSLAAYVGLFLLIALGGALAAARLMPPPAVLAFTLKNHHGETVTAEAYRGHPLLLFFGFTGCSNICPVTLARLRDAQRLLAKDGIHAKILFVTLDPVHDNPMALAHYLAPFGGDMTGLTGDIGVLDALYADFNVYPGGGQDTDHSGLVYVISENGLVRDRFTAGIPAATAAETIFRALRHNGGST